MVSRKRGEARRPQKPKPAWRRKSLAQSSPPPPCPAQNGDKIGSYRSEAAALRVILHIQQSDSTSPSGDKPVRAYLCEDCLRWHLSKHRERRTRKDVIDGAHA